MQLCLSSYDISSVWSDYSLIYKILFLEEKQTFNRD